MVCRSVRVERGSDGVVLGEVMVYVVPGLGGWIVVVAVIVSEKGEPGSVRESVVFVRELRALFMRVDRVLGEMVEVVDEGRRLGGEDVVENVKGSLALVNDVRRCESTEFRVVMWDWCCSISTSVLSMG